MTSQQHRLGQPSGSMRQDEGKPQPLSTAIKTAQEQGVKNLDETSCPSSLRQPTPQ